MIKRLDSIVLKLMERLNVPGVAVSFITNSEISSTNTYGYANKEQKIPVTESTIFEIASISKSVTAWGVMKLIEDELIDLDNPIERYLTRWHLPSSDFNHDEVTIRRVLSNSAGLSLEGYSGSHSDYELVSIEESLSGVMSGPYDERQIKYLKKWNADLEKESKPVRVIEQPGKKFLYSGGGFSILQLIVEEVSKMTFSEVITQQILEPLGMNSSTFDFEKALPKLAVPYDDDGMSLPYYRLVALAAGGLFCPITDLAQFALAGMKGPNGEPPGRGVLKPDSVEEMYTKIVPAGDEMGYEWHYGLGYFITEVEGLRVVQHSGGHIGWRSMMVFIPELGAGIVILINSSAGNPLWANLVARWSRMVLKLR